MLIDKNLKILTLGILFLVCFGSLHTYISIGKNKNIRDAILIEEAKSITSLFKSFRKTYQDAFIDNHITLNDETIELLPIKTSTKINDYFSQSLNAKVILKRVSQRPSNRANGANSKELQIMQEFKKEPSKEYIFTQEGEYVYSYYEPLYITQDCLKCHGKREDAPKLIQERYQTAFGYELNDLRGMISLQIDKNELLSAVDEKNRENIIYIVVNMFILISTIIFLYFRVTKNHQKSKKSLERKNIFLERKAKEFTDLENAVGVSEIISKTDVNGIITAVNDRFCEVSGYSREELIGKNHNIVRHPHSSDKLFKKMWRTIEHKQVFKSIIKNRRKDGSAYHVDSSIVPILNEDGEIKEYIALRHYIEDMMNHKMLLQDIIKSSQKSALIIVKIEDFEELEDLYTADIIMKFENRFFNNVLSYFPDACKFEKVYRLENGEFGFIKEMESSEDFVKDKISLISTFQQNVKKEKYLINGYEFNVSVLISFSTGKENLYENAKLGLKKLIRENKTFINANFLMNQVRQNAQQNADIIKMIKAALEAQNILSYYQPLYNNSSQKIEKYESLVRLIDENEKVISPFFFLETAKKAKYYNYITRVVIDNSFKVLREIDEDISINLSFLDIEDDETREYLYEKIDNCSECHRIVIELLEDETARDFKLIEEFIARVKLSGISIAIDDFGSGYSNFERLLDFQPDILKIDGSLIKNLDSDSYSRNIVETIQVFANREGIKTVAEFVHSKEIFDIVNEIGIDYTQGYYIDEPKSIDKIK